MNYEKAIKTALGVQKADLILKNAQIINVFTREMHTGDIAISEGKIAGIGSYDEGVQIVDLHGSYVAPGFIDAHVHVESSMVTPPIYCQEVLKWGTTTLITDPHEITNVCGADGVQFMLDSSKGLPVNYYIQIPSCVPATPFEHSGDVFTADKMKPFQNNDRVKGLGEVMDYPSVAGCSPEMIKKLELFENSVIDGHGPGFTGNRLQAYGAVGIRTDHESTTFAEAYEKLRAGIAVLIREGSACKNLEEIVKGVLACGIDTRHLAFCTDDKHLSHIRKEGTIRHHVKRAIALGMDPLTAIQIATINAAELYRLYDVGAVAAGYRADLVVLSDLEQVEIAAVYKDGKLVKPEMEKADPAVRSAVDERIYHSVHYAPLTSGCLTPPDRDPFPVIEMVPGNITTKKVEIEADRITELLRDGTLRKIAVIERHHGIGSIGVGYIKGYGLTHGALATTVAHDSHNVIVVGDEEEDMRLAVETIGSIQGGYVIVSDGKVLGTLPLPVAGLMSDQPAEWVIARLDEMLALARERGVTPGIDPFTTLSFMALPVIPEIRITDMGIYDVVKGTF